MVHMQKKVKYNEKTKKYTMSPIYRLRNKLNGLEKLKIRTRKNVLPQKSNTKEIVKRLRKTKSVWMNREEKQILD